MDWKIGEIRNVNGHWVQCVVNNDCKCGGCVYKDGINCLSNHFCKAHGRADNTNVLFKVLDKVGSPYRYCFTNLWVQKYKLAYEVSTVDLAKYLKGFEYHICDNGLIEIEINFHKEFGNKKAELDKLIDNYISNKIMYSEFEKEIKALYVDGRMEDSKSNLKPFSLELAKQGKPVCTRDGRKARIICFDAKGNKPIIALIEMGVAETPNNYPIDGKAISTKETPCDLMMLPEKKEGWVNIYRGQVYNTFEKAEEARKIAEHGGDNCLKTIKIKWEE